MVNLTNESSADEWFCYATDMSDTHSGAFAIMYDESHLYLSVRITGGGPVHNPNTPSERPWNGHTVWSFASLVILTCPTR